MNKYKDIDRSLADRIIGAHGYDDFRWIKTDRIPVKQWVRFKCVFGCPTFNRKGTCPPNVPSIAECREFFSEYHEAVIFHFREKLNDPEKRHEWSKKVNNELLKVERDLFLAGYYKAFLLFMDECCICKQCAGTRADCTNKKQARPNPESLGVDVFATVRQVGYELNILKDFDQPMDRYAILMVG